MLNSKCTVAIGPTDDKEVYDFKRRILKKIICETSNNITLKLYRRNLISILLTSINRKIIKVVSSLVISVLDKTYPIMKKI